MRNIPIHVLTTEAEKYKRRIKELQVDLRDAGLGGAYVLMGKPSEPYWASHKESFIQIWERQRCPFLHLEDDARIIPESFSSKIHVPTDACLAYLGGTVLAYTYNKIPSGAIKLPTGLAYSEHDHEWLRVWNMYSSHAILVLNDEIKQKILADVKKEAVPIDVSLACQMPKYPVYLRKQPFWYQTDGHNNDFTRSYYPPPEGSEVI